MSELIYRRNGDYLLPEMGLTEAEKKPLGKYGMMRRQYLEQHRPGLYTRLLLSGKLNSHLEEIDRQATETVERLTSEMAKAENVTESLKASNQMLWVQKMNNILNRAEETVLTELIYS